MIEFNPCYIKGAETGKSHQRCGDREESGATDTDSRAEVYGIAPRYRALVFCWQRWAACDGVSWLDFNGGTPA
ncbi:hypothetical protein GCM10009742_43800 [Kribbella karoonensis]|uniref:Uncharacterized protein n=1 Tax=Kribbella karoonensis TaxID=324851 RepID=A0ABN2E0B7_9ACTN